jgi:DNA-binding NarL/FixJ family response regulator
VPEPPVLRVFLVDDDDRFLLALRALVEAEGAEVVGTAGNGAEALRKVEEARPDVVTVDLDMPVMDGVDTTREICARGIPVVIVSGSKSSERVGDAIAAGARAVVVKSEAVHVLGPLLRGLVHA